MKRILACMVIMCSILFQENIVRADNHAREYVPAPPGCFATVLYYNHASGDTMYNDGRKISDDYDFKQDVGTLRLAYYYEIAGFEFDSNFFLHYGTLDLDVPAGQGFYAKGMGDPILQTGIFLYNNNESKTWLGFGTFVFPPLGNYDNDGILSLGSNQWRFREEFNFTKGFCVLPGHNAYFEVTLNGDFFTDNDDYTPLHYTKSTDPILTVESHLSYDITSSFLASVDYYYHNGGETQVEGIGQHDKLDNHTIGFSLAYNLTRSFQVLVQYKNDVEVESGLKTQAVVTRLFYICDVGYMFGKKSAVK